MTAPFAHAVIIGVGLIGGSLALAMRRAGLCARITGVGRGHANLHCARQLGIIDEACTDLAEALGRPGVDLVIIAVPMGAYHPVFAQLARHAPEAALISDVGSTKRHALAMAERHLGASACRFVPAHPIAGAEQSGAAAARAELFAGHWCVLTPGEGTDAEALTRIEQLWRACGARVLRMDADTHDDVLAGVSHLPHIAAYALVNAVRDAAPASCADDPFAFAAGGFRDFTRIASSSPEMWRDIALANADALLDKLDAYQAELTRLRQAIAARDGEALLRAFGAAKEARDQWVNTHGGAR